MYKHPLGGRVRTLEQMDRKRAVTGFTRWGKTPVRRVCAACLRTRYRWTNETRPPNGEIRPLLPGNGYSVEWPMPENMLSWLGFSWWPYLGNLARLSKNERTAFWPNILGVFGAAALGEVVGLLAAAAFGDSDPTVWMTHIGGIVFGVVALGFVAFANVTSMINILYTSIVGLRQVIGKQLREIKWGLLVVAFCLPPIAIVFLAPGIYDGFFIFLVWTSALNSSLAGIGIADYFFLRGQRMNLRGVFASDDLSPYKYLNGFNPSALLALVSGFVGYVVIFNPQTLDNVSIFQFISASLPSCVLAGIVHLVLTRVLVKKMGWGAYQ